MKTSTQILNPVQKGRYLYKGGIINVIGCASNENGDTVVVFTHVPNTELRFISPEDFNLKYGYELADA